MEDTANVGIDKLAQMFMGNPQPLQQKVQQDEKQAKPGDIPPDLKEALALQKIQEMNQAAQNQQAMQAGGPQPTVVQKLHQMLAQSQAQAQPQMPPQMAQAPQGQPAAMPTVQAAHGGHIAHLVSNLGHHYDGGGIVAFNGEERSDVPKATGESELQSLQEARDRYVRAGADTAAIDQTIAKLSSEMRPVMQDDPRLYAIYQSAPGGGTYTASKNIAPTIDNIIEGKNGTRYIRRPDASAEAFAKEKSEMGVPQHTGTLLSQNDLSVYKPRRTPEGLAATPAAAAAQTGQVQPRPPAAPNPALQQSGAQPGAQPGSGAPAPQGLNSLLEANIDNVLNRNEDAERDKGAEYYRKTVGLDALLKDMEDRAAAREARNREAQASRTPEWVRGLQALGGAPIRGGLGMVLGQAGHGATAARDEYAAADAKFADEQDHLRDIITKARIEGNTGVANAGIKALENLRADRHNALTAGTSLQTERERAASAEKVARENRIAQAAQHGAPTYGDKRKEELIKAYMAKNPGVSELDALAAVNAALMGTKYTGNDKSFEHEKMVQDKIKDRVSMIDLSLQKPGLKPDEEKRLLDRRAEIERQVRAQFPAPKGETTTPSSDNIQSKVEAAGQKYEPTKYEYRVAPDGSIQRKAK